MPRKLSLKTQKQVSKHRRRCLSCSENASKVRTRERSSPSLCLLLSKTQYSLGIISKFGYSAIFSNLLRNSDNIENFFWWISIEKTRYQTKKMRISSSLSAEKRKTFWDFLHSLLQNIKKLKGDP